MKTAEYVEEILKLLTLWVSDTEFQAIFCGEQEYQKLLEIVDRIRKGE